MPAAGQYREFAPCEALREHVRAFFSFGPVAEHRPGGRRLLREIRFTEQDPFGAPMLADGRVSLSFCFERAWVSGGPWRRAQAAPGGEVVGPMTVANALPVSERRESVGAFLRAGRTLEFTAIPVTELANRVVALDDLWGRGALSDELAEDSEAARIDRLEAALLRRLSCAPVPETALNVPGLAACIVRAGGRSRIEQLAETAGVSRQHLTRTFREAVGVTPKLFARLARFRAALAYASGTVDWAQSAADLGYADQSHLIADFRQFSGVTPEAFARQGWFHPFIQRERSGRGRSGPPGSACGSRIRRSRRGA